jgi:hypothetical protein
MNVSKTPGIKWQLMCRNPNFALASLYSVWAAAAVTFGTTGCRENRNSVAVLPEAVMLQGTTVWFPLSELRQLADKHVLEYTGKQPQDPFEVTASVYTDAGSNLVTFQYYRGFGLPVYYVTFDRAGKLAASTNRVAQEFTQ